MSLSSSEMDVSSLKMESRSYSHVYFKMLIISLSLTIGVGFSKAFLPIMADELDPTGTLVGFVTAAWFLARAFVEFPSGLIAIKVGIRNLVVTGLLLSMVGTLICAFSNNIYVLILGTTVWGFGVALFFTSITALTLDLFKREKRGKAVGTLRSIQSMGLFIGAPIGAILTGFIGFNNIFILASMLLLFPLLIALFSQDLKKADIKAQTDLKEAVVDLKSWALISVSFIALSTMLVSQGIVFTVLPLHLHDGLNMSVDLIGLIMGAMMGGMICGTLISGLLSDRVGRRPLIIGGLLIGGACVGLYTTMTTFEATVILATLSGVGLGFVHVSLIVFMSELVSPSIRVGALGVYRTFMDVGGILGPIIFMLLYGLVNAYASFWSASLLFFFNITVAMLIKSVRTCGKNEKLESENR